MLYMMHVFVKPAAGGPAAWAGISSEGEDSLMKDHIRGHIFRARLAMCIYVVGIMNNERQYIRPLQRKLEHERHDFFFTPAPFFS